MKRFFSLCSLLFAFASNVEAQPNPNAIKVAAVGNSITQGPGRDHPKSYPMMMQEMLGDDYEVKNFGVSGRTLLKQGDFPYWDEPQFEEVKAFAPDILVIKLGTNDSKPQNWEHKEEFEENFIELINSFQEAMPEGGETYIVIPVPVMEDNWGINEKILREEIAPILLKIAARTGSHVIDLHTPLRDHKNLFPDGVHPNEEGLRIMAEVIAEEIRRK